MTIIRLLSVIITIISLKTVTNEEKKMTERELKKLSKTDLLEILLDQSKENEELRNALEEANAKLADRTLQIDNAGSLAEASLKLNGVFEAAQAACLQYSENIKLLSFRQEQICSRMEAEANARCELLEQEVQTRCTELERDTRLKCELLEKETDEKCSSRERETETKCAAMLRDAKEQSEAYWNEVSGKIQDFTKSYEDLQRLWNKSPFAGKE